MPLKKITPKKKRFRILFVKCSGIETEIDLNWPNAPPIGLLYISSFLKHNWTQNFDVRLEVMDFKSRTEQEFINILDDFQPDIVGLSAVTAEFPTAKRMAKLVKQWREDTLVVLGGPHATSYPPSVSEPGFDYFVIGEGEITFVELLKCLTSNECNPQKVKGIAYHENGYFIQTPPREFIADLDSLPFPDWSILDIEMYQKMDNWTGFRSRTKWYINLVTSRGCPFRCIYCHNIFGKRARQRTPENVIKEILLLHEKFNIGDFMVVDDIFNIRASRMMRLLDLIIDEYKLDIHLTFPNGLRGDILTQNHLERLYQAGTYYISFAIESASPRLQKLIRKNLNIPKVLENIKFAHELGIITNAFFMIGFPTETKEEMLETLRVASLPEINLANIFTTIPQYNTELYLLAKQLNKIPKGIDLSQYKYYYTPINCSDVPDVEFEEIKLMAERIASEKTNKPILKEKMRKWDLISERTFFVDAPANPINEADFATAKLIENALYKIAKKGKNFAGYVLTDIKRIENKVEFVLRHTTQPPIPLRLLPQGTAEKPLYKIGEFDLVVARKSGIMPNEIKPVKLIATLINQLEKRISNKNGSS